MSSKSKKSAKTKASPAAAPNRRKRYAIVGLGGRSAMFSKALLTDYRDTCELVALCDINQTRMDFHNREFCEKYNATAIPTFHASRFDEMVETARPDVVIVTTIDRVHHRYIIRAMELGCDAITEKPLTVDSQKCLEILKAIRSTGRNLKVAFNYRYAPVRSKVKELLLSGVIGEVKSVHFEWLLNTRHGADYFRRWHRDKRNSGGLMVHKATHHFDLVNWWLDSTPTDVFAFGNLAFYGRANAEERGVWKFYDRGTGSEVAKDDPFSLDLNSSERLQGLYLNAEKEDGYRRDQSVFGDGISIEDTMTVAVRYASGAQMSYSLHAYAPWEGYRIAFNGTNGRIELNHQEASYINAASGGVGEGVTKSEHLVLLENFKRPEVIDVPQGVGGHGGGDLPLLESLFGDPPEDPLGRSANHLDGARSILTGIAANRSMETGQAVKVDDLVRLSEWE